MAPTAVLVPTKVLPPVDAVPRARSLVTSTAPVAMLSWPPIRLTPESFSVPSPPLVKITLLPKSVMVLLTSSVPPRGYGVHATFPMEHL